jgi:hypothetical protein
LDGVQLAVVCVLLEEYLRIAKTLDEEGAELYEAFCDLRDSHIALYSQLKTAEEALRDYPCTCVYDNYRRRKVICGRCRYRAYLDADEKPYKIRCRNREGASGWSSPFPCARVDDRDRVAAYYARRNFEVEIRDSQDGPWCKWEER